MSETVARVIGGFFAAYGVVMLLFRGAFARHAARSHLAIARIAPILYPGRSREPSYQHKLWRVMIVPVALFFVIYGCALVISPSLL